MSRTCSPRPIPRIDAPTTIGQIGIAISSYATDHDDTMPGPVTIEQFPTFKAADIGSLPQLLAKYLNLVENTDAKNLENANKANVFVCPSYKKKFPQLDAVVYAMNMREVGGYSQSAWGDSTQSSQMPLRRAVLSGWSEANDISPEFHVDLTQTFAIRDTDALDSQYKGGVIPKTAKIAPAPIHGGAIAGHRNALYFDLHVGSMKLTDQTQSWKPGMNP